MLYFIHLWWLSRHRHVLKCKSSQQYMLLKVLPPTSALWQLLGLHTNQEVDYAYSFSCAEPRYDCVWYDPRHVIMKLKEFFCDLTQSPLAWCEKLKGGLMSQDWGQVIEPLSLKIPDDILCTCSCWWFSLTCNAIHLDWWDDTDLYSGCDLDPEEEVAAFLKIKIN